MRAILTYHSIDTTGSPISCHPGCFARHVAWLASGRVRVMTVPELMQQTDAEDAVAVTFDDAFVSFRDLAAPRLLAHGLPSTLFVVSDEAGRTNAWGGRRESGIPTLPLLDWEALARLHEQGVTLGSHSRTHPDLTELSEARIEDEVSGSAERIAREVGVRPTTFAYPYGRVDARSAAIVERTFAYACTTEFRVLESTANAVRLPRLDGFYFQQPGLLESWGTSAFETFVRRRHYLRRVRHAVEGTTRRMLSLKTGR